MDGEMSVNPVKTLPEASEVCGVGLFLPGKTDMARLEFRDQQGQWCQMDLPVDELLWLGYLVAASAKDLRLEARLAAIVKQKRKRS